MDIASVSTPEIYNSSADFRFFKRWFQHCLETIQYDTENLLDLYDPLRCPTQLLWMLADTMGFRYDNRLCEAFNRFVLLYFMSMIRNRGSQLGITMAAEANLKQFDIDVLANEGYTIDAGTPDEQYIEPNEIYYHRLDSVDIPVNSVYVTPHTDQGYIDIVYFSERLPIDACIEYVRPVGMYCFQDFGVRLDARSKIYVDPSLLTMTTALVSEAEKTAGRNRVADYTRKDYATIQKVDDMTGEPTERRNPAYANNSLVQNADVNAGFRAMYSLQLCNNEHIIQALLPNSNEQLQQYIFGLGYGLNTVDSNYEMQEEANDHGLANWNLFYDRSVDRTNTYNFTNNTTSSDDDGTHGSFTTVKTDKLPNTQPQVNPVMATLGDAIHMNATTEQTLKYTHVDDQHNVDIVDADKYIPGPSE